MTMTADERAFDEGKRTVWLSLLKQATAELGAKAPAYASLLAEREEAVLALRSACEEHGNNDWPDELHLADVIEKHLVRYLEAP